MKNNLLDYLSIVQIEMQDTADEYDMLLADHDDGEPVGQVEAKKITLERLDQTISEIMELRNKIANKPLSQLKEEFLQ